MRNVGRRSVAAALIMVLATLAIGCGSDDSGDGSGGGGGASDIVPTTAAIGIADLTFQPSTLTVAPGTTDITITNSDSVDHTFTLDDGSVDQEIASGQTVTVSVAPTATTGFHCEIHPQMTGSLLVA